VYRLYLIFPSVLCIRIRIIFAGARSAFIAHLFEFGTDLGDKGNIYTKR
jgi:hypothetical protein